MAAVDNVVRRGWKYPFTQMCSTCATDWSVDAVKCAYTTPPQLRLVVQTWRDLNSGRNPFETSWRAHGVPTYSNSNVATEMMRLTQLQAGDIRRAFETPDKAAMAAALAASARTRSISRTRIYRSFMKRPAYEEQAEEVRRSSARLRTWRAGSEDSEDSGYDSSRRRDEHRLQLASRVTANLVRLDVERGRQL